MSSRPTFADRARAVQNTRRGPQCSVRVLLDSFPPGYRQEVEEALDGPTDSHALHRTLVADRRDGLTPDVSALIPSGDTLNRHRRGDCACGREVA